ncbi:MAG: methylmalonyl-CoA mutase family protein [Candidatus Methylomirabilia bacterium]
MTARMSQSKIPLKPAYRPEEVVERKIEPCRERIDRIREFKSSREANGVRGVLSRVRDAAGTKGEDLMPPLIQAVETGATIGEIAGAMRRA